MSAPLASRVSLAQNAASTPAQTSAVSIVILSSDKSERSVGNGDSPIESEDSDVDFREGGYGWVVVASVFLINAHTWGMNSSYAVFLAYYLRSGAIAGSSPLAFAFVGGLSVSTSFIVSPLVTVCIRKFGTNQTLRIGVILEALSFVGASFSTQMWHLLLSQGVCFGIGLGFAFTSTVGVVSQWFKKRRSFANALSTGGSGFGGLIYSLATNAMITNLGLEWAFRILAILAFVVNGICSFTLRDRNKAVGSVHLAFHVPFFKQIEYWFFVGWGFFALVGYTIVVFSIADSALTAGFSASQGSIVAAIFNLSQGIGRPIIGLVSDRFGRINVAGLSTLVAGLAAYFLWIFAGKSYAGLVIYSVFGMFAGAIWPCVAPVGAEVVGLQLLPSALSIYWLLLVLPATFAEAVALELKTTGINGYLNPQILTGTMYTLSFVLVWLLRSWKLRQMDSLAFEDTLEKPPGDLSRGGPGSALREPRPALARGTSIVREYLVSMFRLERI